MPIIYPHIAKLDLAEAQRYAGIKNQPNWQLEVWQKICQELLIIATPKASYEICGYCEQEYQIVGKVSYVYDSKGLHKHLRGAESIVVLTATLGKAVDEYIEQLFKQDNYAQGLCANAAATALIEQVADYACRLIEKTAYFKQGRSLGQRFSPGYGDWPLTEQQAVAKLINLAEIGLELTASCFLQPKKSITALIPIKNASGQTTKSCESCANNNTCEYRKEN